MLSPEERALKNRANAQKSTGPKTAAGKERSAKNAVKHGQRADFLKNFVPPHSAVLCNQDRQRFFRLHERLIQKYQPRDQAEAIVVRKIVDAEWRAVTFAELFSAFWNREIMEKFEGNQHPNPEIAEVLGNVRIYENQANQPAIEIMHERIQKSLDRIIAANEKRLVLLRKHFPSASTVIERREFDRERREFYRSRPDLEETSPESPEATEAAPEAVEPVPSPQPSGSEKPPAPAQLGKSAGVPAKPKRGPRPTNEASFSGPPPEDEIFQLVEQ